MPVADAAVAEGDRGEPGERHEARHRHGGDADAAAHARGRHPPRGAGLDRGAHQDQEHEHQEDEAAEVAGHALLRGQWLEGLREGVLRERPCGHRRPPRRGASSTGRLRRRSGTRTNQASAPTSGRRGGAARLGEQDREDARAHRGIGEHARRWGCRRGASRATAGSAPPWRPRSRRRSSSRTADRAGSRSRSRPARRATPARRARSPRARSPRSGAPRATGARRAAPAAPGDRGGEDGQVGERAAGLDVASARARSTTARRRAVSRASSANRSSVVTPWIAPERPHRKAAATTAALTTTMAISATVVRVSSVPPSAPKATPARAAPSISGRALAATAEERDTPGRNL